uniref:Uncharacterized protein n=1 Tax=Thermogemmatispora argillosa TaxID=2045280 RepID=A0A455SXA1_9CHLR|nr:hypothetical protein KTA_03950 [Thermogemmatispora argillosa]
MQVQRDLLAAPFTPPDADVLTEQAMSRLMGMSALSTKANSQFVYKSTASAYAISSSRISDSVSDGHRHG